MPRHLWRTRPRLAGVGALEEAQKGVEHVGAVLRKLAESHERVRALTRQRQKCVESSPTSLPLAGLAPPCPQATLSIAASLVLIGLCGANPPSFLDPPPLVVGYTTCRACDGRWGPCSRFSPGYTRAFPPFQGPSFRDQYCTQGPCGCICISLSVSNAALKLPGVEHARGAAETPLEHLWRAAGSLLQHPWSGSVGPLLASLRKHTWCPMADPRECWCWCLQGDARLGGPESMHGATRGPWDRPCHAWGHMWRNTRGTEWVHAAWTSLQSIGPQSASTKGC